MSLAFTGKPAAQAAAGNQHTNPVKVAKATFFLQKTRLLRKGCGVETMHI